MRLLRVFITYVPFQGRQIHVKNFWRARGYTISQVRRCRKEDNQCTRSAPFMKAPVQYYANDHADMEVRASESGFCIEPMRSGR